MIETLFPNLPKVELFARSPCEGWDVWGQEAPANVEEERERQQLRALPVESREHHA
jgi:N6-adenosine-specific RNA methylase IME4